VRLVHAFNPIFKFAAILGQFLCDFVRAAGDVATDCGKLDELPDPKFVEHPEVLQRKARLNVPRKAPRHSYNRDTLALLVRALVLVSQIEREINGKTPQERKRVRNERSRPLVTALEAWLREQRRKLSARNEIAKAIQYMDCAYPLPRRWTLVHVKQRCRAGAARHRRRPP
jgi:hypothetical protein